MNSKLSLYTTIFFAFTLLISCKTETKNIEKNNTKVYSLVPETTTIGWTAYKTTDKVAVKGVFQELNVKVINGSTKEEALNGLEFSIPVSSIFSKNEDRDSKLKKFFFGVMDATELLTGKLIIDSETTGKVEVKMNGVTNSFPIKHTIKGQLVTFSGTLNIQDWNAQNALNSLNKICFELHKGADGISKTWDEVTIDVSTYLKVSK